ncbi:MAG: YraN family protein [Micrococcales bacterium]|nr:MAG: YraN family protein [Micrococcales bacterium]
MALRQQIGRHGEDLACAHLNGLGMTVLERNWRCAHGELDLVMDDAGTVVAVEVKTRRSTGFGDPVEAVTPQKLARLRSLLGLWLAAHPGTGRRPVRVDVVGVFMPRDGEPRLRHLKGVD